MNIGQFKYQIVYYVYAYAQLVKISDCGWYKVNFTKNWQETLKHLWLPLLNKSAYQWQESVSNDNNVFDRFL